MNLAAFSAEAWTTACPNWDESCEWNTWQFMLPVYWRDQLEERRNTTLLTLSFSVNKQVTYPSIVGLYVMTYIFMVNALVESKDNALYNSTASLVLISSQSLKPRLFTFRVCYRLLFAHGGGLYSYSHWKLKQDYSVHKLFDHVRLYCLNLSAVAWLLQTAISAEVRVVMLNWCMRLSHVNL